MWLAETCGVTAGSCLADQDAEMLFLVSFGVESGAGGQRSNLAGGVQQKAAGHTAGRGLCVLTGREEEVHSLCTARTVTCDCRVLGPA